MLRVTGLLAAIFAAIVCCTAVSTPASAICADGQCGYCNPCNAASWCYDPCSNPNLSCYAAAGCGGPVCSECNPSTSCYDPCSLSCFDEVACGAGPSDPSPVVCGAFADGQPEQGAIDFGFAHLVQQDAPPGTSTGSFTLCIDIPAGGESRILISGTDNSLGRLDSSGNLVGIPSAVLQNYNLPSATMGGSSLSAKDRSDISKCVENELKGVTSGSPNSVNVTTTCPAPDSNTPFSRVIFGNPSSNLASAMNGIDAVSAVRADCEPRKNGVSIVDASKNRNNRKRCDAIIHEFFHTLGLVHVEDRPPDFQQDIMQNPNVDGKRYKATDGDGVVKNDGLPHCSDKQNTKKKVREALQKLVQPVCGDGKCDAGVGETCETCRMDCTVGCDGREVVCNDHHCDPPETCSSCPTDCGSCGGGDPVGVCCEFTPGSNCIYTPCGSGWQCINNSCYRGCTADSECAYLCEGSIGGMCICNAGQCQRTSGCVCNNCTGPYCCPPGEAHCRPGGGGPGGGGDPLWEWCFNVICKGDWDCADGCYDFFLDD